jgi:hypothetical protein
MSTTLTLANETGTYSVSLPDDGMPCDDLIERLFIPVMKAAGYSEATIESSLKEFAP